MAPHLRAGKLRVIAVTEKRRNPLLKDIPTMAELGYEGVEVDAWYGMLAPTGTPAPVIAEMRDDHARYGRIVRELGIKAD